MPTPIISRQKILAGAGNNHDLLEVLSTIAQSTEQQQAVTSTTANAGVTSTAQPNPAARVPGQATGSVSILGGAYVVQLVNPGGTSPISQVQAAQQAGSATPATALQPVTPIRHQIRASTSPAFNVNSNTQTFGGTQGSTQTYWTLTGLGTGTWYVQFRSSYDGINFNTWKNANGGTALGGLINQVTEENAGNSDWAVFTLPGKLIAGIGAGEVSDQEVFGLASQVYSSGMFAIAGPNGFPAQGNGVSGWSLSDVDIQVPTTGTAGVVGIPDFPVEIRSQMVQAGSSNLSPSNATVFAIAFDPTNPNVSLYPAPSYIGGGWAVVKLPGGARVAFGQGKNLDGSDIFVPSALTFVDPSRMMSVCSLTDAPDFSRPPMTGYGLCQLSGLTAEGCYLKDDGSLDSRGIQSVNWLAIAWEIGTDVQTVGGFPFLSIQLQGTHAVIIGAGQVASGAGPITLPAGYSFAQMLSICTPGGSDASGNHMRGVQQCAFEGLYPLLYYTDNTSIWSGAVNFMLAAWK